MSKTNSGFAESYEGCRVVANLMGLSEETVRKRVGKGLIPAERGARGIWRFHHNDLVAAGIEPFKAAGVIGPRGTLPRKANATDVIFVLDRSSSMSGLAGKVRDSLNEQVAQLRKASGPFDSYTVSVINFDDTVDVTTRSVPVQGLPDAAALYLQPNGMTALYDAIGDAISLSGDIHYSVDPTNRAVLISVLTDGAENRSQRVGREGLREAIRRAIATGRYTFTYAGPPGSQDTAIELGIPAGNVTTWDTTIAGIIALGATTRNSLDTYTQSRSRGVMSSTTFYAQPTTTDAAKFALQLDGKLDDVTQRVKVERVGARDPLKIADFSTKKFGGFKKGSLFYELREPEKVQDYKEIVVQDTTAGQFFRGWGAAKRLLGLPDFRGTVRIRPGTLGEFKVFVQSTSLNRKLTPGTAVVKLDA